MNFGIWRETSEIGIRFLDALPNFSHVTKVVFVISYITGRIFKALLIAKGAII